MNNLNSIIVEGNLVRDPESRETPKGTPVCRFSLASNRYYKVEDENKQEVSFFEVETWSKLAQQCHSMLRKGRGARVVGRLKQDRWTDTEGKAHSKIKIVAEHVEFKPVFNRTKNDNPADAEKAKETADTSQQPLVDEADDPVFEQVL